MHLSSTIIARNGDRRTFNILAAIAFLVTAGTISLQISASAQAQDNGIVVGQAKLFDERSLEAMLNSVKSGLASANFINPAAVSQNEGLLQGGETTSSSVSATAEQLVPHTASPAAASGTSTTSSTGAPQAASSGTTFTGPGHTVYSQPNYAIPATTSTSSIGISAPLAVSSEDTLQQQLGLSFEATNLQLLLQHSLSDRLIFASGGDSAEPRDLAVLGFQITVEPRTEDKYSVAEAEITVSSPPGFVSADGNASPEVALMLPQDKTYNVAKVTSDSRTIGLGAFAAPFTGSLSAGTSRNNAFVVYDVDTVALQRPSVPGSNSVSFAWQFRPVLGERSVQPGTRQVYVLLSLPVAFNQDYTPTISVRTYWKKLDTKSNTVDDHEIDGQSSAYQLPPLAIHKIDDYDDGLKPVIDDIESHDAGNGQIYIEAMGSNFTGTTRVLVAGQPVYATEKGGRLLDFTVPIAALQYANPIVIGDYGLPVDMVQPALKDSTNAIIAPKQPGEGISISSVSIVHLDEYNSMVKIQLVARNKPADGSDIAPILPSNGQLAVTIGDQVYGLDDSPVGIEDDPDQTSSTTIDVRVPTITLKSAQKVTVRYAFCGDDYRADYGLPISSFVADSVSVVTQNKQSVVLAIQGDFHQSLKAFINGVEFDTAPPVGNSFLELAAKAAAASGSLSPRGVSPFLMPAQNPAPSYNLALVTADKKQITGAKYIVLYEQDAPAQLLSLANCMSDINPPAPKSPAASQPTVLTPSQWEMWGSWNPSAKASSPSSSVSTSPTPATTAPAAPLQSSTAASPASATAPPQIYFQAVTTTKTTTSTGRKAP